MYDPLLGRFLSADPIVQAPMNGQSFNRYSYVFNNPLKAAKPGSVVRSTGLARILKTAETVQGDWLASGSTLERQGLGALGTQVERFRLTLGIPKTRDERDLVAAARAQTQRLPMKLEFAR